MAAERPGSLRLGVLPFAENPSAGDWVLLALGG